MGWRAKISNRARSVQWPNPLLDDLGRFLSEARFFTATWHWPQRFVEA
jgi:hypothetical protein